MPVILNRIPVWLRWTLAGIVSFLLATVLFLGFLPFGAFKGRVEQALSNRFGRLVTVQAVERVSGFSFTPTVALRGIRVPQADWAGPGDLARIGTISVRLPVLPLLLGRFEPQGITVDGAELTLVRDAHHRESWRRPDDDRSAGGGSVSIHDLTVTNSRVSYRDAVENRQFTVAFSSNANDGVRLRGSGSVRNSPVTIAASGPDVASHAGNDWPFRVALDGPALRMQVTGTMDRPLDTGHMTIDLTARANDLEMIDAVVEAGLIGTQPVQLAAHARHDADTWNVSDFHGIVGQSDIAGHIEVRKEDGRTKLDGAVVANRVNFDDFATSAGLQRAAALEQRIGLRLVPNTTLNLANITHTDGTLAFTIRSIVGGQRPSALRNMTGRLVLDHQKLTVDPLRIGLDRGTIQGTMVVDQHRGERVPLIRLDLRLVDTNIEALAGGGGAVSGRVDGHASLAGRGSTLREAVGASDGRIGFVVREGHLPARVASLIGFDVVRGLTTDEDAQAGLRCVVLDMAVRGGTGRVQRFTIDTTRSQSNGTGTMTFPGETLAITMTGAPKDAALIRLPGRIDIGGTIKDPQVAAAPGTRSFGNILRGIGRSIFGGNGPRATDADCGALAAAALR